MDLRLTNLKAGDLCQIIGYEDNSIASKLVSMGIFPNSEVFLLDANRRKSVYMLVIGKLKVGLLYQEANSILVKKLETE
ncbi:MAG: ferrous iron transport protein A [Saprospiraceae bacterium]|nr:ferrous iron transport protein A [Saprospiraceae bacterium]